MSVCREVTIPRISEASKTWINDDEEDEEHEGEEERQGHGPVLLGQEVQAQRGQQGVRHQGPDEVRDLKIISEKIISRLFNYQD